MSNSMPRVFSSTTERPFTVCDVAACDDNGIGYALERLGDHVNMCREDGPMIIVVEITLDGKVAALIDSDSCEAFIRDQYDRFHDNKQRNLADTVFRLNMFQQFGGPAREDDFSGL